MMAAFSFRMRIMSCEEPSIVSNRITRCEIERIVDVLIAMLDEMEGDADFEPDNDGEPSLGWTEAPGRGCSRAEKIPSRDLEMDAGDEGEMDEDREPYLGFPIAGTVRDAFPREERFEMFRRFRDEFDFDGEPA